MKSPSQDLVSPSFGRQVENKTLGTRFIRKQVVRGALYLQSYLRVFAETGKEKLPRPTRVSAATQIQYFVSRDRAFKLALSPLAPIELH